MCIVRKKLDVSGISVGDIFDSFDDMCVAVGGEPGLTSNRRTKMTKKIKKYLDYEYDPKSRKYKIKSIFDVPLDFANGNSKYVSLIEYLFLTKVMESKSTTFTASTDYLLMWLYMVNLSYDEAVNSFNANKRIEGIESVMFVDPDPKDNRVSFSSTARDVFFSATKHELTKILNNVLSSIKSRHALTYRKETVIITKIERNHESGRICNIESHVASLQEEHAIDEVCASVLKDMGIDKEVNVYRYMRQYQFSALVNMRLRNLYGWESIYKQLRIVFTPSTVQYVASRIYKDFPSCTNCDDIANAGMELNKRIVDRLKKMCISNERFPSKMEFSKENLELINSYIDKYIAIKDINGIKEIDNSVARHIQLDNGNLFRDNYNDIDMSLPYYNDLGCNNWEEEEYDAQ